MKNELELTVLLDTTYELLNEHLLKKGMHVLKKKEMYDIYMMPVSNFDDNLSKEQQLNSCIIIRRIDNEFSGFTYKYKQYLKNGDLVENKKFNLAIVNLEDGKIFLEAIGYKQLFTIKQEMFEYANEVNKICVQNVKGLGLFVEVEAENEGYNNGSIFDELKDLINKYTYNIINNNYYAKKAILMMEKIEKTQREDLNYG